MGAFFFTSIFFFFFFFFFFLLIENLNLFFHHHFPDFLSPSFKLDQMLCSYLVIEKYVHRFGQEDGTNRQAGGHTSSFMYINKLSFHNPIKK